MHEKNVAVAEMKETLLIDKHKGKSGVYFMKHIIDKIVKFGCSENVTNRIKAHKNSFGANNIYLDKVVETPRYRALESSVRPLANTTYTDKQDHTHTEIIQYGDESELESIYGRTEAASRMIALPEYCMELEIEKERSKQEEFKMRQLELQIKLVELQNGTQQIKNSANQTERNPLFKFLSENAVYTMGQNTSMKEIRERFSAWIGNPVRSLDNGTFGQIDQRFVVEKKKVCKSCGEAHIKGCCAEYGSTNRSCQSVVKNLSFLDHRK